MRVSKFAAFKIVVTILTVLMIALLTKPSWSLGTAPSCINISVVTGNGCIGQSGYCTYYKWNYETTWQSTVKCCYNATSGNLESQTLTGCVTAMTGNCCAFVNTTNQCNATGCPTTNPN
jgi:hypothetical protein